MNNNFTKIMEEVFGNYHSDDAEEVIDEEDWPASFEETDDYIQDEQQRPINNTFNIPVTILDNNEQEVEVFYFKSSSKPKKQDERNNLTEKQKLIIALLKEMGYPINQNPN